MRILVTFAVEAELAPFRRLRDLREMEVGGVTVFRGKIGAAQVDCVVTGMGAENATRVANVLMGEAYAVCVVAGFAGALVPELGVGTVVVAESVQQLGTSNSLAGAGGLTDLAREGGARLTKLVSSDHVIRAAEEKRRLAGLAGAVDMESFAVLAAAVARNRPAVVIRAISDGSDGELPGFVDTLVNEDGSVNGAAVFRQIARHPLQLPALIRLGRESKSAAERLAHFLDGFVEKISISGERLLSSAIQEVAG